MRRIFPGARGTLLTVIGKVALDGAADGAGVAAGLLVFPVKAAAVPAATPAPIAVTVAPEMPAAAPEALAPMPSVPALAGAGNSLNGE